MAFLKIPVGARAQGLGDSFVGVGGDVASLYWNPAAVGLLRKPQIILSHVQWPAEIGYEYAGLVWPLGRTQTLGVAVGKLHMEQMPVRTIYRPEGDGRWFGFGDDLFQLTYSRKLTSRFTTGFSVKYVRETLDNLEMDNFLVDLGTFYYTGYRDLTLAVSFTNFGPVARPGGTYVPANNPEAPPRKYQGFAPPMVFRLGGSLHLWETPDYAFLTALQVTHPVDYRESYHWGGELSIRHLVFLRGGLQFHKEAQSWSTGLGLLVHPAGRELRLDWSYGDFGILDYSQRLTLVFRL
jgi:hypothetical protein